MQRKTGDMFDATEQYILQQCNCMTLNGKGLAAAISQRYPYADVYGQRRREPGTRYAVLEDRPIPGTVEICDGNGPSVICLYGQYRPGKATYANRYPEDFPDRTAERQVYFNEGLKALIEHFVETGESPTIAVPHGIGCGLAGGDWRVYQMLLENFAEKLREQCGGVVVLYRLAV